MAQHVQHIHHYHPLSTDNIETDFHPHTLMHGHVLVKNWRDMYSCMPAQVIGAPKSLDAASHVPEKDWYFARHDWNSLLQHCQRWDGKRDLMCLDVFSYSQGIRKTFERAGYKAMAYDIKSDAGFDITTKAGFVCLLNMGMSILSLQCMLLSMFSLFYPFYSFLTFLLFPDFPVLICVNYTQSKIRILSPKCNRNARMSQDRSNESRNWLY